MDPQEAAALLTAAGLMNVPTDDGYVPAIQLSEREKKKLAKDSTKGSAASVAKRFWKAQEALKEMKEALPDVIVPARLQRAAAPVRSDELAVVPFVQTVPLERVRSTPVTPPTAADLRSFLNKCPDVLTFMASVVDSYMSNVHVRFLIWGFRLLFNLLWFAPIAVGYLVFFYVVTLIVVVLQNPEVLVSIGYSIIDSAPAAVATAGNRVLGRFYNETMVRLR